jgi:maltose O-acetyltransferase
VIGNDVWLGVGVMVLKGARIGDNTVIGANSVVIGEIPANVVAAGNPCKIIRALKNNL